MDQVADDLTGIPRYIGERVSQEQLEETISQAESVLGFIEARNGQMAYAIEKLGRKNSSKHIDVDGSSFRPSEVRREFQGRISQFDDYESGITENIEVVTYSDETPFEPVDLEEASRVPDFDINDWAWPRENLWPFE